MEYLTFTALLWFETFEVANDMKKNIARQHLIILLINKNIALKKYRICINIVDV
jgi:hypothetical protein